MFFLSMYLTWLYALWRWQSQTCLCRVATYVPQIVVFSHSRVGSASFSLCSSPLAGEASFPVHQLGSISLRSATCQTCHVLLREFQYCMSVIWAATWLQESLSHTESRRDNQRNQFKNSADLYLNIFRMCPLSWPWTMQDLIRGLLGCDTV